MGVWLMNKNPVRLSPEVDDDFILKYDSFCRAHYPFGDFTNPFCSCPWYFNKNNEFTAFAGKFAEAAGWYNLIVDKFFTPMGYTVVGNPEIVQEYELPDYFEIHNQRVEEFFAWELRLVRLRKREYDKAFPDLSVSG